MSATIIVSLVICMLFLFVAMVLSATGAAESQKGNTVAAHKYSMWSAVASGLSIGLLVIVLIVYINSGRIVGAVHGALGKAQGALAPYAQ